MKHTHSHNTMRRNNFRNNGLKGTYLVLGAILSVMTFGAIPFGYFRNLVTEGSNPFAELNRGQLKQMWWLQCLYR